MSTWVEDSSSRAATIVRLGKKAVSSYRKSYKVFGITDDRQLHDEANQRITSVERYWQYPGKPQVQLMAESYEVSYLGDDAWQITINYSKDGADANENEPRNRARSFDTSGGNRHITQGLSETRFGNNAPNQNAAIGVDDDSVAGVDIVTPQLSWTESYDVPNSYVTSAYIKQVASLTGTVNGAAFRTFAAGEVLFLGCNGSQEFDDEKGKGPWSLSYKFVASPNEGAGATLPAFTVGPVNGVTRKGHDYWWVRYEDDVGDNTLLKKPKYVYVDKVYRDGDFSLLGIGTT